MRILPAGGLLTRLLLFVTVLATVIGLGLLVAAAPARGQDIRQGVRQAEADRAAAEQEARAAEAAILADREKLLAEVVRLETRQAELEAELQGLDRRFTAGTDELARLQEQWSRQELGFREISGNVRLVARDLESLLEASPLSAGQPWRLDTVSPLLDTGYFPDIDDISAMAGVFRDEIERSGQVSRREGAFIGRDGTETTGQIFQLGKFTTIYRTAAETGFLTWSPDGHLRALPEPPPRGLRRDLGAFLAGESASAPVDLSGGAALRQISTRVGFVDHLLQGGPIVWPILAIAVIALALVIYKVVFLHSVHGNTDRLLAQVTEVAGRGDWNACAQLVDDTHGGSRPLVRVIKAGLGAREAERETLESVLQEAILHELPVIQRGIAILAVLGAVAPLLGLLGTVTGMIDTFRIITLFGTGDPKLMSGGISEALVTTELGLAVAIPIMLLHTLLSRRVDHIIGDMEESAVQLTNIILTNRSLASAESLPVAAPPLVTGREP